MHDVPLAIFMFIYLSVECPELKSGIGISVILSEVHKWGRVVREYSREVGIEDRVF